ncbi:hypothetical protein ACIRXL_12055 [Avibacterium paragallinarum]|uniref:hypothetical protein n=1 Tax=Avibacterium paragallinarum TaxID=728 RepID=UPI00397C4AD0
MRVELSQQFIKGRLNTPFFKDVPAMSEDELKCLFLFMQDIQQGKRLRGKNKPSWLDDNLNEIPHTEIYQQNNIWHYHCGPYQPSNKYHPMSALKINLEGETSGPVIHYQKVTEEHIVIIAYSPNHQPFPKESDIPNPLTDRIPEK